MYPGYKPYSIDSSPPACGKTYISKQLARNLKHVVYLDKDTLIPLSNRVFAAAGEEINRSSKFFEENIRDYEYETIVDIGVEALEYDDIVLINASFTKEVHNEETLELKTVDFSIPEPLERLDAGHDLILFHNSSDAEFDESMRSILPKLEED